MVYFQIDNLEINENELILDATVAAFTPKGSKDIMNLITRVAENMRFNYTTKKLIVYYLILVTS